MGYTLHAGDQPVTVPFHTWQGCFLYCIRMGYALPGKRDFELIEGYEIREET